MSMNQGTVSRFGEKHGVLSPVLETNMSLVWGTFSTSGDSAKNVIFLECPVKFTTKKRILKPFGKTPFVKGLNLICSIKKYTIANSTEMCDIP